MGAKAKSESESRAAMNACRVNSSSSLTPLRCFANSFIVSSRLSAIRCYRPLAWQGGGRNSKGGGGDVENEEEKELMFSKKQLAPLRLGKDGPDSGMLPSHTGKVALPKTISRYTVLRSPFVHKKSREQFEIRVHRQLLFIKAEPHELQKKFFWLKRLALIGMQYEVIASYQTRLGDVKKILNSPGSDKKPKAVSPAR
uniref:Ribosomal protein S10 n=1 Tax=Geranium incanum TaxID=1158081 RepID=A0A0G2YJ90_9ROSI|nr:ribosomal protein S10 [Geranium incanum]